MVVKHKNTLNNGSVRCIIFREGDTWYGIALEFNLIEEGQSQLEAQATLDQAIRGYVETARKHKLRPLALNQKAAREYEELWAQLQNSAQSRDNQKVAVIGQKEIFSFGYNVGAFAPSLSR